MRAKGIRRAAAGVLLGALAVSGCASGPNPEDDGRFFFMVGCWRSEDGVNQETWTSPIGGVLFGHAQRVEAGRLTFFEQSRIDTRTQPATLVVTPNGGRPVTFVENPDFRPAPPADGRRTRERPGAAFENADNDFPQRVAYRRGEDGLEATVSQFDGSRASDLRWERCRD